MGWSSYATNITLFFPENKKKNPKGLEVTLRVYSFFLLQIKQLNWLQAERELRADHYPQG